MAGTGASYVLDKGFAVLSTYNTSNANGVEKFRCVALGAGGTIDLNASAAAVTVGVVQEDIDRAKVATGKAVANVRLEGITRVIAADGTPALGGRVMPGTGGGVVAAATATNFQLGIVVGAPATVTAGDIIEVLLRQGVVAA